MKIEQKLIKIDGVEISARLQFFEKKDKPILGEIYQTWRLLCELLESIDSRRINLPEGLSESAFALAMDSPRLVKNGISGVNTSFDCFNLKKNKRIQVKACSVMPDLTSFGPKSVWDQLYFCDFYKDGKWNGQFDIYEIDTNDIYSVKVNQNETFREQQDQKRRPRFSIYRDIIQPKNMHPIKTYNILDF